MTQWLNIDTTTISDVGLAPWLFNLYIDPKEQYAVGHRMNAWLASMAAELKAHAATCTTTAGSPAMWRAM
jgi:hypothetical protein